MRILKIHLFFFYVMLIGLYNNSLSAQTTIKQPNNISNRTDSSTVWKMNLSKYIYRIDSLPATITGGCVALTCGTIDVSLLLMALDVSSKNEKNTIKKKGIDSLIVELRIKRDSLSKLADYDNMIYQRFIAAYKLPHSNNIEKGIKDSILHITLLEATFSPLKAAHLIERILLLSANSIKLSGNTVFSDVKASTVLLNASFDAIIILADDNIEQLGSLEGEPFKRDRDLIVEMEKIIFNSIIATKNKNRIK